MLWAHASTPAVLWRPLSAPSASSPSRHRGRWGPRSPRHKFQLLTPGPSGGPCLCTETAALIQGLPQKESLTSWRGWGRWVLRTDQMQAPPRLHSSPGHPTVGNQKPRQGEQLLSSPGLRTCLATGLGWGGVPQGPSCPAVQYVLPPRGGGHSAQGSELGLPCAPGAPWLNRPTAVASERPLLQQGLPSPAWPHLCRSVPMCSGPRARDDGFPPRPRPPTPQSSQVNRLVCLTRSSPHPPSSP